VALAKALELSRLEEEKRQPARPIQHDPFLTRQPGHGDLVAVKITETVIKKNHLVPNIPYSLSII